MASHLRERILYEFGRRLHISIEGDLVDISGLELAL